MTILHELDRHASVAAAGVLGDPALGRARRWWAVIAREGRITGARAHGTQRFGRDERRRRQALRAHRRSHERAHRERSADERDETVTHVRRTHLRAAERNGRLDELRASASCTARIPRFLGRARGGR